MSCCRGGGGCCEVRRNLIGSRGRFGTSGLGLGRFTRREVSAWGLQARQKYETSHVFVEAVSAFLLDCAKDELLGFLTGGLAAGDFLIEEEEEGVGVFLTEVGVLG